MDEFREILDKYGIDYQGVMERFMNNQKMFIRLLDMFMEDDNLEKLGKALEINDYAAAFEAAHTLKGVTANMGLTLLYHAVCDIVEPLRSGENRDYNLYYRTICAEYEKVAELKAVLEEYPC